MTFVHEEAELRDLLTIVGETVGIDRALVEKDYWVTHTLWALERSALDIWFKGGTSLSKGFGLIERFSEDLDLHIEPGEAPGVPKIRSWTDAARIITRRDELPPLGMEVADLIEDMLAARQIRHRPAADDPAWLLRVDSPPHRALCQAHQKTAVMFWGKRFSLQESCEMIQGWLKDPK